VITDFLLEHAALVPLALVLTAVLCAGVGYVLLRTGRRAWLWPVVALAAVLVAALTLTPTGSDSLQRCAVQFSWPTLGSVELLANVALLLPLTFFATLVTRRPGLMLVAGVVLSVTIEGLQALVPAIGRSCDTNDWAMNTLGVLVAAVMGWALLGGGRR
jgi:hypothetical protein